MVVAHLVVVEPLVADSILGARGTALNSIVTTLTSRSGVVRGRPR